MSQPPRIPLPDREVGLLTGGQAGKRRVDILETVPSGPELDEDLLVARAYLSAVAEPPAPQLSTLITDMGPIVAAERVRAGKVSAAVADEVAARRQHLCGGRIMESARELGIRLVVPEHDEWRSIRWNCLSAAAEMEIPGMAEPIGVWVRGAGSPGELLANSVAIVGARAASGYGEQVSAEFGYSLSQRGVTIVSGAAYGIDGSAHQGALKASKPTVAFLACGLHTDYPAGHARLLAAIAENGAVISEYPPGTPPRKHRFLVRNRLIAATGLGTVVVEAGARSGASNTANTADALGRPVMAVPGPITSRMSLGCHELVRSGKAILVTKPEDIIEIVSPLGEVPISEAEPQHRPVDELDQAARRVYDALAARGGISAEVLARDSGLPLGKVRAVLPRLELSGFARRVADGWVRNSPR